MKTNIGVMGCLPELPLEFPLLMPENSGNMVHASAPLLMFDRAVHNRDEKFKLSGEKNFRNYVNRTCSHLIITMANTLIVGKDDNEKYLRLRKALEQYEVPIVVFGLGIQDKEMDLEKASLCDEAVKLLEFLAKKANFLGVRGAYTKAVIEKCCNIDNIFITGCPSLFSNPKGLELLYENIRTKNNVGKPAISVTNMNRDSEKKLLSSAINSDFFLIEPVSKLSHQFYIDSMNRISGEVPYFLDSMLRNPIYKLDVEDRKQLEVFYQKNYKLFRSIKSWYEFNTELVSYSYGTRFHVNMATILSGKPALWLTHDARTRELTDFFHLPSLDLNIAASLDNSEIKKHINYDDFFENIERLFENFNAYLFLNGLPEINSFRKKN